MTRFTISKIIIILAISASILISATSSQWGGYPPCTQDVVCHMQCPSRGYLFGCNPYSEIRCSVNQQQPQFYNEWFNCGGQGVGNPPCSCPDNKLYVRGGGQQQGSQGGISGSGFGGIGGGGDFNGNQGGSCSYDQECEVRIGNGGFCKKEGGRPLGVCLCRFASHWYYGATGKCIPFATQVGDFCLNDGHCRFIGSWVNCREGKCYYECRRNDPNCGAGGSSGTAAVARGRIFGTIYFLVTLVTFKLYL